MIHLLRSNHAFNVDHFYIQFRQSQKVSGIKRHIAVDTRGLPHTIAVTTADVTDRKGSLLALGRYVVDLTAVQSLLADRRYVSQPFAQAVEELLGAEVRFAKCSELHA